MYFKELKLTNFKNCSSAELSLSEKINCFIGHNGAGKTNILDAVYYLAFCKSCFTSSDKLNIKHGEDFFAIHGELQRDDDVVDVISCVQKDGFKKSFKINKKEYDRLSDHIGKVPLVMISPYDNDLINGGSELRRKFVDGVISQFDGVYLNNLMSYNRALLQRNVQLKSFMDNGYFNRELLAVWDDKLLEHGQYVFDKRKEFIVDFMPVFQKYYDILSDMSEKVEMVYVSELNENAFPYLLLRNLERDRISTYTNSGVHKDDFNLLINGYPLKRYGSQGQQKSFVIAVKLAQFDFNCKIKGFKPILLLDDIFDKLDNNRVAQLVRLVGEDCFGQVFITDTQRQRMQYLLDNVDVNHKIFEVNNGSVL